MCTNNLYFFRELTTLKSQNAPQIKLLCLLVTEYSLEVVDCKSSLFLLLKSSKMAAITRWASRDR